MKSVKPPQFIHDLYRDLRDRRLLFPVIALLLCLVAVPILLGGGSGTTAVPVPVVVDPDEAVAVQSAVLVEDSGIRNYRQRLEALKEKNPFEQKFALPDAEATEAAAAAATDTSAASASGGAPSSSSPSSPVSSPSSPVSSPSSPTTASSPPPSSSPSTSAVSGDPSTDSSTDADGASTEPAPEPEIRFYAGRVDVSIGPVGDGKVLENVRYLNFLPNDKAPVVAYLGLVGGAGERAVFSISSDVSEIEGDEGSCAPKKPAPCQFLTLKVGEERVLRYGPDATPYRLKLLDTHVVEIPDPRDE